MGRKITSAIIILLMIGLIAAIPYIIEMIPQELIDSYGPFLVILPIGFVIVLLIAGIIVLNKKSPESDSKRHLIKNNSKSNSGNKLESTSKNNPEINSKSDLLQEREIILQELREAEKQFLKHQITKETFDKMSQEKNAELIKIESEIDSQKRKGLEKKDAKKLLGVSTDKRKVLEGLLEQKQRKVHELTLCEQSYLKRRIDESTYIKIVSEIKKEIVSIEAQIKVIQKTEEIQKLKETLKQGAKEIAKQKKNTKERGLEEMIQDDVLDQLNISR